MPKRVLIYHPQQLTDFSRSFSLHKYWTKYDFTQAWAQTGLLFKAKLYEHLETKLVPLIAFLRWAVVVYLW